MQIELPQINVRRIFAGCVVAFCVVSLWIVIVFPDRAVDLWFYFAYMTIACTFLPLPTPQIVMDYCTRFSPIILIPVIGGIGSTISVAIDYALVAVIFRYEKFAGIKMTRTYLYVERIFNKAAFVCLLIGTLIPTAFEPIKLLACVARYNMVKYLLATFTGRTSRYFILGMIQRGVNFPRWLLYGSILVMVIVEVARRSLKRAKGKRLVTSMDGTSPDSSVASDS